MNQCTKCGGQVPPGTPFCLHCGQALHAGGRGSRFPRWLPVVAGLAVLGGAAWSLSASGVLGLRTAQAGGDSMQRRGQAAAGGLELLGEPGAGGIERFGETGPGSLALPGKGPEDGVIADPGALGGTAITDLGAYPDTGIARPDAAMPPDIRAWLEHLKRVDRRREALNRELAPKLINLALNLQPGVFSDEEELQSEANRRMNEAQTSIGGVTPGFQDLIRDFQSFAPPQECRRIADEYNALLFGLTDMVQKVTKALEAKDLGSLYTMLGSSYSQIDQRASNANVLVDHLCRRYREPNIYVLFVETQGGTGVGIGMGDIEKLLRGLGG